MHRFENAGAQASAQLLERGLSRYPPHKVLGTDGGGGDDFTHHTGGELTAKVFDPAFGDPKFLEIPLQCGVRVIAAHSAGRSGLTDPDWTKDLLEMFTRFPNLYGDNSALCSINRARTLKHLKTPEVQQRIIHGSDYPVPVSGLGPWLMRHMSWSDHRSASKIPNIIERDHQLKKTIGFNDKTFTRMDELLQQAKS